MGIHDLLSLIRQMIILQNKDVISASVLEGKNYLLNLTRNNKMVISYLRQYKRELERRDFKLTSQKTYYLLEEISKDITLLEKYIDNARMLEELKIGQITLINNNTLEYLTNVPRIIRILYFKNKNGKITDIVKSYTDGSISEISPETEDEYSDGYNISLKICPTTISEKGRIVKVPPSWLLKTENHANGFQCRYFYTTGFNFDLASYLVMKNYLVMNYLHT